MSYCRGKFFKKSVLNGYTLTVGVMFLVNPQIWHSKCHNRSNIGVVE